MYSTDPVRDAHLYYDRLEAEQAAHDEQLDYMESEFLNALLAGDAAQLVPTAQGKHESVAAVFDDALDYAGVSPRDLLTCLARFARSGDSEASDILKRCAAAYAAYIYEYTPE